MAESPQPERVAELEQRISALSARLIEAKHAVQTWVDANTSVAHTGIHAVTNLVPSTLLHRQSPSRRRTDLVRTLATVERALARRWPFWRLGCSAVFALRRA